MSDTGHLIHLAKHLVEAMDKVADNTLPYQIVDVVKDHSKLAVASAVIPIPGADMAAAAAAIWGMYLRINKKIGLSIGDNILKTVGSGVATNLFSYVAMSGVASALKFIPGIGSIGGALLMGASLYAVTLASGYVYLKALTMLAERNNGNIDFSGLSAAISQVLSDKSTIKSIINDAKSSYRAS